MPKPATVRVLALDGAWESVGIDRAAGIWMENLQPEYDGWGPSKCTFDLRRQSSRPWPDIGAFTPIEVEIAGEDVWVGRVGDTPARDGQDRVMTVQCEGAQFVLDDDLYERPYVHNKLSDWKDARSLRGSQLTRFTTVGKAQTDRAITIGWAKGDVIATNNCVGVTLDLGAAYARSVVMTWERNGGQNDTFLWCAGHNQPDVFGGNDGFFNTPALNGEPTTGTYVGLSSAPVRYITIYIIYTGAGGTFAADCTERITDIRVFADDAYRTGGLLASSVAADALNRAARGLSSDRSGIQAAVTQIPAYVTSGPVTPRKAWSDVDAFHDWVKKIDQYRRPIYKAKPGTPVFEISSTSPGDFNDASANSGEEIYDRVLVTGQTPAGDPLRETRSQAAPAGIPFEHLSDIQPTNPGFATNTAGWTARAGTTLARDTGSFDTSPASGHLTSGTGDAVIYTGSWTAPLVVGRTYVLKYAAMSPVNSNYGARVEANPPGNPAVFPAGFLVANTWTKASIKFTATATVMYFAIDIEFGGYVDSLELWESPQTLSERRGFLRTKELPISTPLPDDLIAADIIADAWLTGHKTTPFKGTRTLVGDGAIRDLRTGQSIGLHMLGNKTMEMVRFADHVDPDTGGLGRDGRMTEVKYRHAEDTAEITIDNSRASFEALLARFGVAVGS